MNAQVFRDLDDAGRCLTIALELIHDAAAAPNTSPLPGIRAQRPWLLDLAGVPARLARFHLGLAAAGIA